MSVTPLELRPEHKVAEGGERLVFVHPDNPVRLIKILKDRPAEMFTRWTFGHLTQKHIPSARYRPVIKQYDEYRRLAFANMHDPHFQMPVSHLFGFVNTTRGLGGVTERVTDADGGNAPTLAQMAAEGTLTDARLSALNAFIQRLYAISVAVGDVSPANFVYGHRHLDHAPETTQPEWVMIDGFGDRYAVAVRSVSHRMRVWGIDDCFRRNPLVPGIKWNADTRQIERET